jgi:outer membrane lipoprotein-sorting protein
MNRLPCIALLLCAVAVCASEPPPATDPLAPKPAVAAPAVAPEVAAVLDQLDAAGKDVKDIRARVTHEEMIPLLETSTRSRGTLLFKKPNRIALKLDKPRHEDIITNGKLWWLVSHNDKNVQVFKAADEDNADGAPEAAFLKFGLGGAARGLTKDYVITLTDKTVEGEDDEKVTVYKLKFVPKKKPGRPIRYQAIQITVRDDLWLPSVIRLEEDGGEIVHTYSLRRIKKNTGAKDKDFECKPPSNYDVKKG